MNRTVLVLLSTMAKRKGRSAIKDGDQMGDTSSFQYTKFPSINMSGTSFAPDTYFEGADLTQVTGLTPAAFASVQNLSLRFPSMDATGWQPAQPLSGADLTRVSGVTLSTLANQTDWGLFDTKLPSINLAGWQPTGWQAAGADLSNVTGLTAADFLGVERTEAEGVYGVGYVKMPPNITRQDMLNAGFSAEELSTTIFSQ